MRNWIAAVLCMLAGGVQAQDARLGQEIYGRYCASCHGTAGDGMGPMRPVLMVAPSDLTQLSARNGGSFPLARLITRVDGTSPLVSHGDEMPVYGDFFTSGRRVEMVASDGARVETSAPIADLVAYLETLQE
jgi:mono/diheme cytochrome c family protein